MNTITLFFIFIPILAVILLFANLLLAVHRPDSEKVTPYECGFSPVYGQTRNPFSIQFYLVGILFLVFDIELLMTYPFAVNLYQTSAYGFWIFVIFFLVLTVGFIYEFGTGALYFTDKRSSINNVDVVKSDTSPFTNQKRSYFTSSKNSKSETNNNEVEKKNKSTYLADAYEKDLGQSTENVHLKAQRHIQSGNPTDHTTINEVQKAPHSIPITQEELDKLASISPSTILLSDSISEIRKAFQAIVGVGRSKLDTNKRVCGVYVFTNLITNDQLVGSSMSLSVRLAHYFKPSTLATSSRSFFKHLTLYKYSDFKLDIYIVKNGYTVEDIAKLQSLVLCLEQYSIFTLNSTGLIKFLLIFP
jgi:NADH:ubiquinone oxidoreductase subunit 3 (subunit A)